MPVNEIYSTGSIQIGWPSVVTIGDTVTCIVQTYKKFENACVIDSAKQTITIVGVFGDRDQTAYINEVIITLNGVVNPANNKEKVSGFTITTYADELQIYRIDFVGPDRLVPTLDCDYPCWQCYENEPSNC